MSILLVAFKAEPEGGGMSVQDILRRTAERAEASMKILEQIDRTKAELRHVKPRSRRRVELETRLVQLLLKQIRLENRMDKKAA
jgi:hypothetical protein